MKKITAILLSAAMAFSFVGCNSVPSDEKIKAALSDGTITVADAKSKGWIDDAWIKANFEQIEAGTKVHMFDDFDTTYLDGTSASSTLIAGKMLLVFFNTAEEKAMEKLKVFQEIATEIGEIGIPTLGITTDKDLEAAKEKLTDITFPIIVYNEEMQTSLEKYSEMFNKKDAVSVFTKDGGFYSAWNSNADAEKLMEFARSLADEKQ